ncbi:MAG: hypothetical protein Q4C72_01025 [Eubacteriales bacterium]|nr:hypothetical protein [Eubacteriales bacterium]
MNKRLFTPDEMELLRNNPNVFAATPREIQYTNEFKEHFMERYLAGEGPAKIFSDAGLPVELLGYKRIERASYHWRRAYEAGELGKRRELQTGRTPKQTLMGIILEQRLRIRRLERELHSKDDKSA